MREAIHDSKDKIFCAFLHIVEDGTMIRRLCYPWIDPKLIDIRFSGNVLNWHNFSTTILVPQASDLWSKELNPFTLNLKNTIKDNFSKVHYVSAFRGMIKRNQDIIPVNDVGLDGGNTIAALQHMRVNKLEAFSKVEDWAKKFDIDITTRMAGLRTWIAFTDNILSVGDINIQDGGAGLNQLLPVIVQIITSEF
jgi:hypothetical protein